MVETIVLKVDPDSPDKDDIEKAASILRSGGTVAFPTETVYGLGANALDSIAVGKIFRAKGRPADNPLIVHVAELQQVDELVTEVPLRARRLMEAFWPGPLTIILPSKEVVPKVVTGGLDTVAVRMPNHAVALALIKAAGLPVAAPSANTSGKPSPTEAEHVIADLEGKIDAVLDGGFSRVGLESTVLDMTGDPAVILRPGGITREELEGLLGHVDINYGVEAELKSEAPKSPGMKYRHYSPKAEVILVKYKDNKKMVEKVKELMKYYQSIGYKVAVMARRETLPFYSEGKTIVGVLGSQENLSEVGENLFRVLRNLDAQDPDIIIAEGFPETGIGAAVMNRLSKAAAQTIDGF